MNPAESRETVESVVKQVSAIVSRIAGIKLGPKQAAMVETRLQNRIARLCIEGFAKYLQYLNTHLEGESQALLSLMTTHHTYFFREFSHFEFLINGGLQKVVAAARTRGSKKIQVWSAAASRGQEVYSLAMFLDFHLKALAPEMDYEIWGTDVDPESIEIARNAVYKVSELNQAPTQYIAKHWIRGKGNVADFYKLGKELRTKCHFQASNLLKEDSFLNGKTFDIIFCRNVFIYFENEQIKQATQKMMKHLDSHGFLFLGVSETLNGLGLQVVTSGPSIYQHLQVRATPMGVPMAAQTPFEEKRIQRVLCVDDSGSILALLKKILVKDSGFEVIATAKNGEEALALVQKEKFDVITLDLHMPILDGLGFLKKYRGHAPVVVVSAINRDEMSVAQTAIALGAADYVEKPSLENIAQASNEIRAKLKTAISLSPSRASTPKSASPHKPPVALTKQMKTKVLIVDDSQTIRQLLERIIIADPDLEVVGKVANPLETEEMIKKLRPDVITLDIHMPEMDGVTLLKRLHPRYHIPTVMISSLTKESGTEVLDALENGAVDYIQKPEMQNMHEVSQIIRDKIKTAAAVKFVPKLSSKKSVLSFQNLHQGLILMGASTGGTEALRAVLENLPAEIPPILIVQHIPAVFSAAFVRRLNELLPFEVKEAAHGDEVKPNRVLIAAGGTQMGIQVLSNKTIVNVNDSPPVNRHKPSVDFMFSSFAKLHSRKAVAVLLTGMGADGAKGMKELRDIGVGTIAQHKDSCVVYGMPRAAIELGGAVQIQPLDSMAEAIVKTYNEMNKITEKKSA